MQTTGLTEWNEALLQIRLNLKTSISGDMVLWSVTQSFLLDCILTYGLSPPLNDLYTLVLFSF